MQGSKEILSIVAVMMFTFTEAILSTLIATFRESTRKRVFRKVHTIVFVFKNRFEREVLFSDGINFNEYSSMRASLYKNDLSATWQVVSDAEIILYEAINRGKNGIVCHKTSVSS